MKTKSHAGITKRALLQRINRKLAKDMEQVKACRSDRFRSELGDYYRVDMDRNAVIEKDVDLEDLGRELKALQPWEALESEK